MMTAFIVVMIYADRKEASAAAEARRTIASLQSQLQEERHL